MSEKKSKKPQPGGQDTGSTIAGRTTSVVAISEEGLRIHPQPVSGDPLDPLNWSPLRKNSILAIVMAMYFMFTYITTTTVPSFPSLEEHYNLSIDQLNWTVAVPALGLSLGPLIWSSPADIFGRRPIFILGTVIALASTIGAALAPSYEGYMAARFFQGFGVSPAASVGLAIIGDLFFQSERGQKVGLWVLAIDLGLLAGPLIGGFVNLAGFVWIQWLTAILFGFILVLELLFLPETLYPRDLMLSKSGLANSVSGDGEKSNTPSMSEFTVPRTKGLPFINVKPLPGMKHPSALSTLWRFAKTFKFAVVAISVIVYCFGWYWWVLSVITLIPVAYETFSPQSQGLLFLGLIIGTLFSEVFCSGTLSDWLVVRLAKRNGGVKEPEMRLWLAYPAAVLSAVGLIVWGVSVDRSWHWMTGQVAFVLFGAGIQMGNTAICSYIVDAYPLQSMAVIVFYSVMLNMSAFVDPFFIAPWLDTAGFSWTMAGHTLITIVFCMPALALLHVFGKRIRSSNGQPDWVNPEFDHIIAAE